MELEEFDALIAEVRASGHDEPPRTIPRLDMLMGEIFVASLPQETSYDEIRDFGDWDDLMLLLNCDSSEVAGLDVTVSDWDRDGTVHLSIEQQSADSGFIHNTGPRPSGAKMRKFNEFLDVLTWQGHPDARVLVSSFHINDPDRRLTLRGSKARLANGDVTDMKTPDRHLRMARKWAGERYHVRKFDGLILDPSGAKKTEIFRFNAESQNAWSAIVKVAEPDGRVWFLLDHEDGDDPITPERALELLENEHGPKAGRARAIIRRSI